MRDPDKNVPVNISKIFVFWDTLLRVYIHPHAGSSGILSIIKEIVGLHQIGFLDLLLLLVLAIAIYILTCIIRILAPAVRRMCQGWKNVNVSSQHRHTKPTFDPEAGLIREDGCQLQPLTTPFRNSTTVA